jgi:hypothetical protein
MEGYVIQIQSTNFPRVSVVGLARGHGVEVLVNEMSRRETPSAVLFKVSSIAANDAHPMTWCCIQSLRIYSGEGQ